VAIFNAIKRCEKQYVVGEEVAKKQQELKEYNKIKNDIHAKLQLGNAHQWQSPFEGNKLYKQLDFKLGSEDEEAGTLLSIEGVMDDVFSFLTLRDVVQLEGTCKRFGADPERGRRIAFTTRCFWRFLNAEVSSVQDKTAFRASLDKFTSCIEESPRKALQKFVLEVRDKVDDDIWKEYIGVIEMDPLSLKTLLNTAFDKLAMLVDFDDVPRDYIIAKVLMKEGITLVCGQMLILMNSFDIEDEDSNHSEFSKSLITHSLDVEVMISEI